MTAFNNLIQTPHDPRDDASARSSLNVVRAVESARVPWSFTARKAVTGADVLTGATGNVVAYHTTGRDTHSIICYSATATAVTTFTLEVWGSQTNQNGSYVKIGTVTNTLGETKLTGFYNWLVLYLVAAPDHALSIDFSTQRAG